MNKRLLILLALISNIGFLIGATNNIQLLRLIKQGNKSKVEELLKSGVDVNEISECEVSVPLRYYPYQYCSYGGPVTPLLLAVCLSDTSMVKLLHRYGANLDLATTYYDSPLISAIGRTDIGMIKCLLSLGANVNQIGLCGESLLAIAIGNYESSGLQVSHFGGLFADRYKKEQQEYAEIISYLLDHKADSSLVGKNYLNNVQPPESALEKATRLQEWCLVALLRKYTKCTTVVA